jgi:hypothetical protein
MEESDFKDQILSDCEFFIQHIVQESEIEDLTQKKSILEQMEKQKQEEEIKRIKKRETHEELEKIQKQHKKNETQFRPPLTFCQNNFDKVTKIELRENLHLISFPHDDKEAGCAKKIKGISFLKLNRCTFHKVEKK